MLIYAFCVKCKKRFRIEVPTSKIPTGISPNAPEKFLYFQTGHLFDFYLNPNAVLPKWKYFETHLQKNANLEALQKLKQLEIVFLGKKFTGKTSIIKQYLFGKFPFFYRETVVFELYSFPFFLSMREQPIKVHIWDTAGSKDLHITKKALEQYFRRRQALEQRNSYYDAALDQLKAVNAQKMQEFEGELVNKANVIVFVAAYDDFSTLEYSGYQYEKYKDHINRKGKKILFVLNKNDLEPEKKNITDEDLMEFIKKYPVFPNVFIVSAKEDMNIFSLFSQIYSEVLST